MALPWLVHIAFPSELFDLGFGFRGVHSDFARSFENLVDRCALFELIFNLGD